MKATRAHGAVSRSKAVGRLGWNYIEREALSAGCKPIRVEEDLDTGVDGYLEFDESGATRLVAVQVKRGDSYFDKTGPKHQSDARHFAVWSGHQVPVILILVSLDESRAYWMDVRQHLRSNPEIIQKGPFVLRPPEHQAFGSEALADRIRLIATATDFGQAVAALCAPFPEARMSATPILYYFRLERRVVFCLAAALRLEEDPALLAHWCNFYSRYLNNPETTFGASEELRSYARQLIANTTRSEIIRILDSFSEDSVGGWSGATLIFDVDDEEMIWDRDDTIERGTVEQSIAAVLEVAASRELLLDIIGDANCDIQTRKTAVAVYAYLGHSCDVEHLDAIRWQDGLDESMHALLAWLRYWIIADASPNGQVANWREALGLG